MNEDMNEDEKKSLTLSRELRFGGIPPNSLLNSMGANAALAANNPERAIISYIAPHSVFFRSLLLTQSLSSFAACLSGATNYFVDRNTPRK